ncbi:GpE family phage tail protein [Methyloversatilis sp.]|nr:GpE family phage tail protein [Methyloversatilis sp.]MDP3579129.1 GpE family phage tail protein [Methyloversatilis sp.]
MADIAVVFHWPLSDMCALSLAELLAWRERARVRTQPDQ